MNKLRIADAGLVLSLVVAIATVGSTSAVAAKPLSIGKARLLVTGARHNRPDDYPGIGDFIGWPGGIDRLPNGDLLMTHSSGYWLSLIHI